MIKKITGVVITFTIASFCIYFFVLFSQKKNNIDALEKCVENLIKDYDRKDEIYLFVDLDHSEVSKEINFKLQFVLAPIVVIAKDYVDIPNGEQFIILAAKGDIGKKKVLLTSDLKNSVDFIDNDQTYSLTLLTKN